MQTFLPYANLRKSVQCLDYRRLGKQRVEAFQMLNCITGKSQSRAWQNHPCTRMWRKYPECLAYYKDLCINEWDWRGYNNSMPFTDETWLSDSFRFPQSKMPAWLGDKRLHSSHRASLLHKDIEFYGQYNWREKPLLKYWWPE